MTSSEALCHPKDIIWSKTVLYIDTILSPLTIIWNNSVVNPAMVFPIELTKASVTLRH